MSDEELQYLREIVDPAIGDRYTIITTTGNTLTLNNPRPESFGGINIQTSPNPYTPGLEQYMQRDGRWYRQSWLGAGIEDEMQNPFEMFTSPDLLYRYNQRDFNKKRRKKKQLEFLFIQEGY